MEEVFVSMTRSTDYELLSMQAAALTEGEPHYLPNLANTAALLWESMDDINWCGFYLSGNLPSKDELILGPFMGKPACIRIPYGKGVCGTAALTDQLQLVADVHQFPGHIACDSASNSEIVIPIHSGGRVVGVLDIDAPITNRFSLEDAEGLKKIVEILEKACTFDFKDIT